MPPYGKSVFINAPFDLSCEDLFRAMVFAVAACDYNPRCALENEDSSKTRIQKIEDLISRCRRGIHDLSFMELDAASGLPRFNMPFELGLFHGAKQFGGGKQKRKCYLVFDSDKHRYQKAISDIAGQDISCHGGTEEGVITAIGKWLKPKSLSPHAIYERYCLLKRGLPFLCETELRVHEARLTYGEYLSIVYWWLKKTPQ